MPIGFRSFSEGSGESARQGFAFGAQGYDMRVPDPDPRNEDTSRVSEETGSLSGILPGRIHAC